jgi:alkanesulfonate monooxygenase SsuD/methylene tetrahydromethanopterin reductase-like flavin-dependent oxidoreductase (luciferase family)
MDLCVMIEGQEGVTWADWQAIAAACERHGIPALFRSDHYLPLGGHEERPVLDAWATINALAATTTTLRLGALVSPATFRHPSEFAKLVVTADHVSGGRIDAGLGAGWNDREHAAYGFPFGTFGDRFERYAEQLEIAHGLWGDGAFSFQGTYYTLEDVDAQPKPVQRPLPVIVGGMLPHGARRAIAFGDGWIPHASRPEYGTSDILAYLPRFREMAKAAGRDPAAIPITTFNPPAEPDTLKRYRDAGIERVVFSIASEDRDKTLATLDRLSAAIRQVG